MPRITINGKTYTAPSGDIVAVGGQLFVDGEQIAEDQSLHGIVSLEIDGAVGNIQSDVEVNCGDVSGNVSAGSSVNCDKVYGHVSAGNSVHCHDVGGNVTAGNEVHHHYKHVEGDLYSDIGGEG